MRIDSHQHFWSFHPQMESWITDDMKKIRKDFLPEDLKPMLLGNKFDGCIAVEADDTEEETQFLLGLASENSWIKGVVGWIDLTADNCEERLTHFSKNPRFKGIRHTLQKEDSDFMLKPAFRNGISLLNRFNLSYDLLVLEHQLPAAIELVKEFPEQRFVLDHMAKPNISNGPSKEWTRNINKLGGFPNVYCKVSGFLTETKNFEWDQKEFMPFFDIVTRAFGEDRLIFGSDWPVCLVAGTYEDTVQVVENYFAGLGSQAQKKIMGDNALKFYNL